MEDLSKNVNVVSLLSTLNERTMRTAEQVDKIYHTVFEGNGTPSHVAQLATLNSQMELIRVEEAERRIPRAAWAAIVVSLVIAAIGWILMAKGVRVSS